MAKSELAKKEEELTRAFAKVESLLDELSSLQKRKVSSSSNDQQQEMELDKLQLELEVSKCIDPVLKHDQSALFFLTIFLCKQNSIHFVSLFSLL